MAQPTYERRLKERIANRTAKLGVLGLGYVGLPLAFAFAEAGFDVVGIDTDTQRLRSLQRGESYIAEVDSQALRRLVRVRQLKATGDFSCLRSLDAVSICVPTPLRKSRDPDISYILHATHEVRRQLRPGQLVVLESTTYPGTTEELILPALLESGLKVGRDFFLAFSPERIDPGNPSFGLKNTPKVLGGVTPRCTRLGALLYRSIVERLCEVSSPRTAEMVKLLENTFRAVNIALVNEIAVICDKLGVSVWEVIEAAASKPFGFMPFYPGPGLGGHCIPIDPHYLAWKMRTMNYTSRLIELASTINQEMPFYVFQKIQHGLNARKKALCGARVLLLGVAYKKNVSDTRESPAYELAQLLHREGARLAYADPHVPEWSVENRSYRAQALTPSLLRRSDCAVILADHDAFDYSSIVTHAPLVVDTRHATRGLRYKNVICL